MSITTQRKIIGFTLLEILVALFIFSIIAIMLVKGLESVISAQSGTERNAERLRQLQFSLLILSRDLAQTVNRPIMNAYGSEESAFVGSPTRFSFTHLGYASGALPLVTSGLQRTQYLYADKGFWRVTWPALDLTAKTSNNKRLLLSGISALAFSYLDREGKWQDNWPLEGDNKQPLPMAVQVTLTIPEWGSLSQIYVIPAKPSSAVQSN